MDMEDYEDGGFYPYGDDDDYFDEDDFYQQIMARKGAPEFERRSLKEVYDQCIYPALSGDSFTIIYYLLLCAFTQRIIARISWLPPSSKYVSSISMGVFLVHSHMGTHGLSFFVGLCAVGLFTVGILQKLRVVNGTAVLAVVCISYIIICQLVFLKAEKFLSVRGALMILCMKLVSIPTAAGGRSGDALLPVYSAPLPLLAYCFDPASSIFGTWIQIHDFVQAVAYPPKTWFKFGEILGSVYSFALSIFFMLHCTCFLIWIIPEQYEYYSKWILAFRDAQAFRSSHYFVTLLSHSSLMLAGYGLIQSDTTVSDPWALELPRSLVAAVVRWNVPMHKWLKFYVYDECGRLMKDKMSKPMVSLLQRLITFVVASLIHGLTFQISAILLSLGFYTYIEYTLRNWLSKSFNACVKSWPCKTECSHYYKSRHILSLVLNLSFSFLALFHLAYLGCTFDDSDTVHVGYLMGHTISKWGYLDWASHYVAGGMLLFNLIVMDQLSLVLVPSMLLLTLFYAFKLVLNFEGEL